MLFNAPSPPLAVETVPMHAGARIIRAAMFRETSSKSAARGCVNMRAWLGEAAIPRRERAHRAGQEDTPTLFPGRSEREKGKRPGLGHSYTSLSNLFSEHGNFLCDLF